MRNPNDKKSNWFFPPDFAVLLGFYFIFLPVMILGGWLATNLYNAKSNGDMTLLWAAVVLGAIGTVLLFLARLPLYRQRRFLTFGPKELDERHRRVYWWAYRFIGASVLLLVVLLFVLR